MKSLIQLSVVVLLATSFDVFAQPESVLINHYTFSRYDICRTLGQTDDGGFLLAGYRGSGDSTWIIKIDQNGDSLWSVLCRTGILHNTMSKTDDGSVVLAGSVSMGRDTGWDDFLLFRLDENGETVWSRTYGAGIHQSEFCYDMIQTHAGGYALAGFTYIIGIPHDYVLLLVTDEDGDSLWSCKYDMPTWRNRVTMLQLDDGGFLLAGFNFLLRTNENGDSLWSTEIPFHFEDLLRTEDGGIIVSGGFTDGRSYSCSLMKLDQNCDTLWSKSCGDFESHNPVIETEDHGFLVAGEQHGDLIAIRTDENGDSLWYSTYYGGHSGCNTIIRTSEGGFAFGGFLETSTSTDYLFIKSNDEPFLMKIHSTRQSTV